MIQVNNVTLRFGKNTLFEDVNIKFTPGNCYGLIGANGAGKSTFLKLLSGEIETSHGEIIISKDERIAVLKQNHYQYDEYTVMDTVIMGNTRLYEIMKEKEKMYSQTEFTDEDGIKLGELEAEFAELNGWEAESEAGALLDNLGIETDIHYSLMKDIPNNKKVKVLLAQALFGNPDILLLDEPTNDLDLEAIEWLEEYLINYPNTVIVVSHDRHFLNKVCTHICDIDYKKIKLYIGNYDFWYESSQLALKQMKEANRKKEEKIKELQAFIQRFSANASKSKQATSRKKMLEKIELDEIVPSSRKYPFIEFKPTRESGKEILNVINLSKEIDGKKVLNNISFQLLKGDKVAILGTNSITKTLLLDILAGDVKYDKGKIEWGTTITTSYFKQDSREIFQGEDTLVKWMSKYYEGDDETELRGFLGRMLFSGEDVFKKINVLSGGEKARCLLSKMMLEANNFLIFDEPTNHLDLESITALNNGLIKYNGEMIFTSKDHQFVETIANRIIEIQDDGTIIDRRCTYDEYLESKKKDKK